MKVVIPKGEAPKDSFGTRFYTDSGEEIEGVTECDISIKSGEPIMATIKVFVSDIEGLENIKAQAYSEIQV